VVVPRVGYDYGVLTLTTAEAIRAGEHVVHDGAEWYVEAVDAAGRTIVLWLALPGLIPLVEWARGCPGRFDILVLDVDDVVTVLA
jgi:hypothetical protein